MKTTLIYLIIFLYGTVIGSFLNVCILRIPKGESIVTDRSHCLQCGYRLRWFDLIPLFSYLLLHGKCRQCKQPISIQYPLVEAGNGLLWVLTFWFCSFSWDTVLLCAVVSVLLVISVIDFRTYEIPISLTLCLTILAGTRLLLQPQNWLTCLLGAGAVSGMLLILFLLTSGRGMGGGDIKLMAAAGLLLGWKPVLLSLFVGCLYGCVIHITRMKLTKEGHVLAFGPYLAMGIVTAIWFGEKLVGWYLTLFL
jgi:leader peptidase (prepilin peptidase) / N-methyltransferase